jgi:hypothetical protein
MTYTNELDLLILQLLQIAKVTNSMLHLGLDVGGGTGTFAASMKLYNVTVVTTTMNLGGPYNKTVALRGLVPLHVTLRQRFPMLDGVMDLVRCGHVVNRWIPLMAMEFLLYDVDTTLAMVGGTLGEKKANSDHMIIVPSVKMALIDRMVELEKFESLGGASQKLKHLRSN